MISFDTAKRNETIRKFSTKFDKVEDVALFLSKLSTDLTRREKIELVGKKKKKYTFINSVSIGSDTNN